MLAWFAGLLPVGSPAPDFTLADQDGNEITLSKLRGRNVVLVFYPGDNTRVCTRQLCEFRDEGTLMLVHRHCGIRNQSAGPKKPR